MKTEISVTWSLRLILTVILYLLLSSNRVDAQAENLFIPHPDNSSKQVEYFLIKPVGKGPWPTLIFLHGHQNGSLPGGKVFAKWGVLDQFAKRGYLAVAISQPGYGNSTGPADFCGEFTLHAVSGVIAKLQANGYVSPHKLVIQGISRGALVAGLVAAQDTSISGIAQCVKHFETTCRKN